MAQDTLWTDWEDQDLDAYSKARVEELLADPQFLAWLDHQEAEGTCPSKGQDRHTAAGTQSPYGRGAPLQRLHAVATHSVAPGSHPQGHITRTEAS
jgi:hypothetical protein